MLRSCVLLLLVLEASAKEGRGVGCTAIAIDSGATVDGSAFAGMNTDCADCDTRLTYVPAQKHTEATRDVFTFDFTYPRWVGYGRGKMYHPLPGQNLTKPVGSIPQVNFTYGYYAGTMPLINDQGVGFGESSCSAMLMNKFPGDANDKRDVPTGFLDPCTLMQLVLERCDTARCAVDLLGDLVETHGFLPSPGEPSTMVDPKGTLSYDDGGEAFTIADKKGEAWIFHVTGGVQDIVKSVWAAQRVPKGHAAFIPNAFIIGELPSEPNEWFRFPKAIFRAAHVAGLWNGHGPLDFSRAFGPYEVTSHPTKPSDSAPLPLYASVRRYGLSKLVAPSLNISFMQDNMDYPFSVKVERPMSHRDAMKLFRYHYQGTEFDMTQGVLAGPFRTPFRVEGGDLGTVTRGISVFRTVYSIIAHTGPQRQLGWFAIDTPATSVYIPLYSKTSAVAKTYSIGVNTKFDRASAWWIFDFVNNWMQLNYQDMSTEDVLPAIEKWQNTIDHERLHAEKMDADSLGQWQISLQERLVADWQKMADHLIVKYNDGQHNDPSKKGGAMGTSRGYPKEWAEMVGFNQDVHPLWVQPAERPPKDFEGYFAPTLELPTQWDSATGKWAYSKPNVCEQDAHLNSMQFSETIKIGHVSLLLYTVVVLIIGMALGRKQRGRGFGDQPLLARTDRANF